MSQAGCRIRNLMIITLLLLSGYNILLTVKLMYSTSPTASECPAVNKRPAPPPAPVKPCDSAALLLQQQPRPRERLEDVVDMESPLSAVDLRLGRWDDTLKFKLFDHVVVGDKYPEISEQYKACLATQSSLEKLFSLVQVAKHWTGPISVALYAAGDDEFSLLNVYVAYLRKCFVYILNRVSFHLAYPRDRAPKEGLNFDPNILFGLDCAAPHEVLEQLLQLRSVSTKKWREKHPYPQNHLRNLARKNCQSGYVFLTDVDIIPSVGLAEGLDEFLRHYTCNNLCAFVIPTFELDDRVRFPQNKSDLVRLAKKGLARPFHSKVFIFNQYATNFTRWQINTTETPNVHISHVVTNFEFLYEPFYVASDVVPPHDERFLGYGFTRNSQVYEMFLAGYEFIVLSPAFTIHWGLQVRRTRPQWREQQNRANSRTFNTFKRELFARYNKDPLNLVKPNKPPLSLQEQLQKH